MARTRRPDRNRSRLAGSRLRSRGMTLGIVGLGLMGGSVALAARRSGRFARITAADSSRAALRAAESEGAVDRNRPLAEVAAASDVLVVAVPPGSLVAVARRALECMRPGTLVTDTGSTKRGLVLAIGTAAPRGPWLVPAHPLAGSERSGFSSATPDLLDAAPCPVTPVPGTPREAIEGALSFWRDLGLRPFVVSAAVHDRAVARTSHLLLLLAASLAGGLDERTRRFVGPAFRDATRVASCDPATWTDIVLHNRDEVLRSLHWLRSDLEWLSQLLEREDRRALEAALRRGRRRRDALPHAGAGPRGHRP
jgi:prephenate dehydrogenase